tara:strand:+ start:45 stop:449 length:405 start_codon:yes stop_codon:yes gene_type:complete
MSPESIQDEAVSKPFIHTLGKIIIFLTGFYILELVVIGPLFNLYIVFGAMFMLTGMLVGLCTAILIFCGFPFGLLLMLIGNRHHQRVLLSKQTPENKDPKLKQEIFLNFTIITVIILVSSLLIWFLSLLNSQGT